MIRRLRSRAALALVATAGLGLAATGFSTSASAGTNCPSGYHCVFWTDYNSSSHQYFDADSNFANDTFNVVRSGGGGGATVNNNFDSASNSSNSNYESHYWDGTSGTGARLFCVNPGENATQSEVNAVGGWNRGSSLTLPGRTSVHCI